MTEDSPQRKYTQREVFNNPRWQIRIGPRLSAGGGDPGRVTLYRYRDLAAQPAPSSALNETIFAYARRSILPQTPDVVCVIRLG